MAAEREAEQQQKFIFIQKGEDIEFEPPKLTPTQCYRLAHAAYKDDPGEYISGHPCGLTFVDRKTVKLGWKEKGVLLGGDWHIILCRIDGTPEYIVAFDGTENWKNWVDNIEEVVLDALKKLAPDALKKVFLKDQSSVIKELGKKIDHWEKHLENNKLGYITTFIGHSRGGAFATYVKPSWKIRRIGINPYLPQVVDEKTQKFNINLRLKDDPLTKYFRQRCITVGEGGHSVKEFKHIMLGKTWQQVFWYDPNVMYCNPTAVSTQNSTQTQPAQGTGFDDGTQVTPQLIWSDDQGFSQPYATTFKINCLEIHGLPHIFASIRYSQGIELIRYNPLSQEWHQCASGPRWSDKSGYGEQHYFATIKTEVITIEAAQYLYVVACGPGGVELAAYNPYTDTWSDIINGPEWIINNAYDRNRYYLSFQTAVMVVGDHQRLLIGMNRPACFEICCFDPESAQFQQLRACDLPGLDKHSRNILASLKMAPVMLPDGQERLYLLSVDSVGVNRVSHARLNVHEYDFEDNNWTCKASHTTNSRYTSQYTNIMDVTVFQQGGTEKILVMPSMTDKMRIYHPESDTWVNTGHNSTCIIYHPWAVTDTEQHNPYVMTRHVVLQREIDTDQILIIGRPSWGNTDRSANVKLHCYNPTTGELTFPQDGPDWLYQDPQMNGPGIKRNPLGSCVVNIDDQQTLLMLLRNQDGIQCCHYELRPALVADNRTGATDLGAATITSVTTAALTQGGDAMFGSSSGDEMGEDATQRDGKDAREARQKTDPNEKCAIS